MAAAARGVKCIMVRYWYGETGEMKCLKRLWFFESARRRELCGGDVAKRKLLDEA